MNLPTISVITPSFNQGQFIRQTVESVLSQDYPNLEYIIMDGGSTDSTLTVLEPYRTRLTLISEKDRGQTDAINKGLRMATGDVVCWLNSDDYFLPNTLRTVGDYFRQHPDQLWLTGDCQIVSETGKPIQQPIRHYKRLLRAAGPVLSLGMTNAVCQPATFWRRSVHEQAGFLNESLHYTMDYDFWLRLRQLQNPVCLQATLSAFRIHNASKGGSHYITQFQEDTQTAERYWNNVVMPFHKLHNRLIINMYRLLK